MADDYERSDVHTGWLAAGVVVLLVTVPSLMGVLAWLSATVWDVHGEQTAGGFEDERPVSEGPAPQAAPAEDLAALKERAEARLVSYGWVDREQGVAHIPLADAMRLMARENEASHGR